MVLIPNILFSSLVISTANCGPLSNITLSSNPYSFYTLFLNNLTNPSTDVSSVIATNCVILDNLSQTTRIVFFLATNSNFIIKSTIRYVYSFFSISLNFTSLLVPPSYSSSFDTYYNHPHTSIHPLLLPATSNSSLPTLLSFICLHVLLLVHYDVARLSLFSASHPSVHTPFLLSTLTLSQSATHLLILLLLLHSSSLLLL